LDENNPIAEIKFGNNSSESCLASLVGIPPEFKNNSEENGLIKKLKFINFDVLIIDEFKKDDLLFNTGIILQLYNTF